VNRPANAATGARDTRQGDKTQESPPSVPAGSLWLLWPVGLAYLLPASNGVSFICAVIHFLRRVRRSTATSVGRALPERVLKPVEHQLVA
jgi:hypothetical protein